VKHPALRVAAWQWIVPEYQKIIVEAIVTKALPSLPFRPVRVELVGSLVRGCGHLDSDFDFNLAAHDWNEQIEWRRVWSDQRHRLAFLRALNPLIDRLAITLEVAPNNPDQHTYDLTYDLLSSTYSHPERFPDATARWWDGYQLKWMPRPLMAKNVHLTADNWVNDLEPWMRQYGSRFLTYSPRLVDGAVTTLEADLPCPTQTW
jgi:hypothetical protein